MGSATTQALTAVRDTLNRLASVTLRDAEDLFAVVRLVAASSSLRSALTDNESDSTAKNEFVSRVFSGKISPNSHTLLSAAAQQRWSHPADFVAGVEELGIRVAAEATKADKTQRNGGLDAELFAFERTIRGDAQLELALGSKLGSAEAKVNLVEQLLSSRASAGMLVVMRHLVQSPRGRRIGEMLRATGAQSADQRGFAVATVTSAVELTSGQIERLAKTLQAQAGRAIHFDTVIDPSIIGGIRIQVGDDVIDGSVASRLDDLRLKLAG